MFRGPARTRVLTIAVAAIVTMSLTPTGASGQTTTTPGDSTAVTPADGRHLRAPSSPELQALIKARLARTSGRITVFVELAKTSAADASEAASPSGKSASRQAAANAKRDTDATANSVTAELKRKDPASREVSRTKNAVSGVILTGSSDAIKTLAARPDVANITPIVPKTANNAHSAVLTKVLQTWHDTGKLGDGVRVGIIDTGVDYTHADFGGPGTEEAFDGVDPTASTPLFPNAKVVGGTDLAGENYDSKSDNPAEFIPAPDGNPIDCDGHGTHVGGTAAGYGVNSDGSTFTGDYTTLDETALLNMRIGPGMAPHASLYAIKVFGCPEQGGSTDLVGPAIDWALDPNQDNDFSDHLDLVNISIGTDFGAPDDPDAAFVRNAAKHGMLSVISAGNGGDLYDVGGSPGNTPEALTVASSRGASVLDAVEVTAPAEDAGLTPGQYSLAFDYEGFDKTRAVVEMTDPDNLDGCDPFSVADAANVAGKYVWLEWDDNDDTTLSQNFIAAYLMKQVGPTAVATLAKKMGITSEVPAYPSIALGSFDASVYDMVGAYSVFANKGIWTKPTYIVRVEDRNGVVLYSEKPIPKPAMNEEVAYVMTRMLRGVVTSGTGWRLAGRYGVKAAIGGKTGTTQNNSDGWFMGISPQLVAGVWTGCEDRAFHFINTAQGDGATTALPIFAGFMKRVYANPKLKITQGDFEPPKSGVSITYDCNQYQQQEQKTELDEKLGF